MLKKWIDLPIFLSKINRIRILAISIGIIYIWFGALKFLPDVSPAESLAKQTITALTFSLIPENWSIVMLAFIEVWVGLLLLVNHKIKLVINVAIIHLILTFLPILFFPSLSFVKNTFCTYNTRAVYHEECSDYLFFAFNLSC